jgi:Kef-type K+ transport system membrane component KefB
LDFQKIGQPSVIGEIIAGIVLGPSLLGLYFPEFSGVLFPAASLEI